MTSAAALIVSVAKGSGSSFLNTLGLGSSVDGRSNRGPSLCGIELNKRLTGVFVMMAGVPTAWSWGL